MRPEIVIFDLGGVVFEFYGGHKRVAEVLGASEDLSKYIWQENDEKVCLGLETPDELWQVYLSAFARNWPQLNFVELWASCFEPIWETHALIKTLADKKIPVGILSNIYSGVFEEAVLRGAVPDINYQIVVKSCDEGVKKPDREIYEITQERLGITRPRDILFVDDLVFNMTIPRQLGWQIENFNRLFPALSVGPIENKMTR